MVDGEWIPLTPQLTRYPLQQTLAPGTGALVVVTGEMDYVTDGHRIIGIHGGDPLNDQSGRNWLCIIGGCRCLLCVTERYAGKCRICLSLDETSRRARSRQEARGRAVLFHISFDALWQLTQEVQA